MAEIKRIPYDEFSLFHENASEYGIPWTGPPVVRRTKVEVEPGRSLSALVWGTDEPEYVFLHGGAQNAHTWDTVALAMQRPLVAIDLPGHGHSDTARDGSTNVRTNVPVVANAVRQLAPKARVVIGMSLGGITTIALADHAPELVRRAYIVDVTPGVNSKKSIQISNFVNGPESFPDFDALLARTIEHNPTRTVASLRRGILHNAIQREDGTWVWRYARLQPRNGEGPNFGFLWEAVSKMKMPTLLARGMRSQSVVDDEDEAEFRRRCPHGVVEHFEEAGHSLQGDTPVELAHSILRFATA